MRMVRSTGFSMEKESRPGQMVQNMMGYGRKAKCKVKGHFCMQIRISIKETLSTTRQTVEDYILNKMVRFTTENGLMISHMAMACKE